MQARAIFRAGRAVRERTGQGLRVEIMIPLVAHARELALARDLVLRVGVEEGATVGRDFGVDTMIELSCACFVAGEIAQHAEFFSFGTNDLTQTALGFSRYDIEAHIVPNFIDSGIVERSPFATIDEQGVRELVQIAVQHGRAARLGLQVGVCGEHGGDAASIRFFHAAGWTTPAARRFACRSRGSPRRRQPRRRASPCLDVFDWMPGLDSQSHVEHHAAACHAPDGVEVGLDHLRDLPEQEGKAQHQLAERLSVEHRAAAEAVELDGDALGGVDQLVGFCVGRRQ
jgi:hypothetical protein